MAHVAQGKVSLRTLLRKPIEDKKSHNELLPRPFQTRSGLWTLETFQQAIETAVKSVPGFAERLASAIERESEEAKGFEKSVVMIYRYPASTRESEPVFRSTNFVEQLACKGNVAYGIPGKQKEVGDSSYFFILKSRMGEKHGRDTLRFPTEPPTGFSLSMRRRHGLSGQIY